MKTDTKDEIIIQLLNRIKYLENNKIWLESLNKILEEKNTKLKIEAGEEEELPY
jgi:hypothetical protein